MGKFRYILILLIVLAVAFFTRWLLTSVEEPITREPDLLRHDPDYFISNFKSTVYGKDGSPDYYLQARQLNHFPDNETMEIASLNLRFINKDNRVWLASADRGVVYEDSNILRLNQNVILKRETQVAAERLQIATEELQIDFNAKKGTSTRQVTILGDSTHINAVGIEIDMESGELTLQSEATGHYEPR